MRSPGRGVTDDNQIDAHGLDIFGRVDERLAFAEARAGRSKIENISAQSSRGQAEAGASSRGRLEKQIDNNFACQVAAFFPLAKINFDEGLGDIENGHDFPRRQILKAEQMPLRPRLGWRHGVLPATVVRVDRRCRIKFILHYRHWDGMQPFACN